MFILVKSVEPVRAFKFPITPDAAAVNFSSVPLTPYLITASVTSFACAAVSAFTACLLSLTVVLILTLPLPSKPALPDALPVILILRAVLSLLAVSALTDVTLIAALLLPSKVALPAALQVRDSVRAVCNFVAVAALPFNAPVNFGATTVPGKLVLPLSSSIFAVLTGFV